MTNGGDWKRVAARGDITPGEVFATELDGEPIALTELDGQIYAFNDTCTHEFALLSQGFLEGEEIECPLHQARFDVRTGVCLMGPASQDIDTYEVKVEGSDVLVKRK